MQSNLDFYKYFQPALSPKKMLEYGVFGGSYLGDSITEYPKSWIVKAKLIKKFDTTPISSKFKKGAFAKNIAQLKKRSWSWCKS